MSKIFVLTSSLLAKPQQPVNIFRATSEEDLIKLVQRESRVNAETGIPEWVPTSQLVIFVHPSILAEQGIQVITEIPVGTKEEWMEFCRLQAEEQWADIEKVPTELDRYVTDEERGFAMPDESEGAPDTSFMLPEDSGSPVPAYFVKHPDDSYTAADPQPKLHINAAEILAATSDIIQPTYYVTSAHANEMVVADPQPLSDNTLKAAEQMLKDRLTIALPDGDLPVNGTVINLDAAQ